MPGGTAGMPWAQVEFNYSVQQRNQAQEFRLSSQGETTAPSLLPREWRGMESPSCYHGDAHQHRNLSEKLGDFGIVSG